MFVYIDRDEGKKKKKKALHQIEKLKKQLLKIYFVFWGRPCPVYFCISKRF